MARSRRLLSICTVPALLTVAYYGAAALGGAPPRALPAAGDVRPLNGDEAVRSGGGGRSIFMRPIAVGRVAATSADKQTAGTPVAIPMHRRPLPSTAKKAEKGASDKNAPAPPRPIYKNIPVYRLPMGW